MDSHKRMLTDFLKKNKGPGQKYNKMSSYLNRTEVKYLRIFKIFQTTNNEMCPHSNCYNIIVIRNITLRNQISKSKKIIE